MRERAHTLIMHWNGKAWKKAASPNPGSTAASNFLFGVAAASSGAAWAVGVYNNGTAIRALAVHCC